MNHHQFQAHQLRAQNINKSVESIAVFVFSLFVSALLPSLLFRYFFANQELTEQPAILEYIPVAAFVIGVSYFLYVMVGNWAREGKARRLEMHVLDCDCCDEECGHTMKSDAGSSKKSFKNKK